MKDWDYENDQWTKLPSYLKHLPLFTRNIDLVSIFFRYLFAIFLKGFIFRFYIHLKVIGDWKAIYNQHPRLLLISNHGSHIDATSIAASVPARYWTTLYIAAAKDYFFSNPLFTFFSQHCLGAIPIDRKDKKGEAVKLIITLLSTLPRIWLIIFPEGTRTKDGKLQTFRRGVSLFAQQTQTPILFLFVEGNTRIWPKGAFFAKPGILRIYLGPVHPPAPIEVVQTAYRNWVKTVAPSDFVQDLNESDDSSEELVRS